MDTVWFAIIAIGLTIYVVLDGFDLGVGALHLLAGRSERDRRTLIRSIGPVWDGNEVWLLAGSGLLVLGFPVVYAAAFSGFYLPLMMVLWLLIGRGISLEFRNHISSPLWTPFWDVCFSISSALLAVLLGVALANIVRGVPLNEDGRFFLPLWTDFAVHVPATGAARGHPLGILDGYTVLGGLTALTVLSLHGATWIVLKTSGALRDRARLWIGRTWWASLAMTLGLTVATFLVQPHIQERMAGPTAGWIFPAIAFGGLFLVRRDTAAGRERAAFLASCAFLVGLMMSAAWGMYPYLLPATTDPARGLTAHNASTSEYAMRVALWWFIPGLLLASTWFVVVYRSFAGKVDLADDSA
jgi:cytochrome d ubiquinol oxidase subunit II